MAERSVAASAGREGRDAQRGVGHRVVRRRASPDVHRGRVRRGGGGGGRGAGWSRAERRGDGSSSGAAGRAAEEACEHDHVTSLSHHQSCHYYRTSDQSGDQSSDQSINDANNDANNNPRTHANCSTREAGGGGGARGDGHAQAQEAAVRTVRTTRTARRPPRGGPHDFTPRTEPDPPRHPPTTFPAQHRVAQVLSTTTAPITPTTPDRLCATLVQATHTTGTPQWSWVGEGHVAAATLTARYFFACTREGILHVVTTDGRTAVPAVFVGEGPAAVASMEGKEGDRFAVVTVRGKMLVGVLNPGGRLTMENEIDLSRFVKEDVTGVRIHFVEYSVVKVQIQIKEKDWDDYMYDLNSRCWFVEQQNVFAYSYFNNATPAALNSPFATNSMLTVLAPSLSHA